MPEPTTPITTPRGLETLVHGARESAFGGQAADLNLTQ
jgi:hypothetical protein